MTQLVLDMSGFGSGLKKFEPRSVGKTRYRQMNINEKINYKSYQIFWYYCNSLMRFVTKTSCRNLDQITKPYYNVQETYGI